MNWFGEQIKDRIEFDEDIFSSSLIALSKIPGSTLTFENKNKFDYVNKAVEDIARFYKVPEDVLKRQNLEDNKTETLAVLLENIFGSSGVMRRDVELKTDWYKNAAGVYLGITKENRYAALIPDFNGYSYTDYSTGKKIRVNSETQKNLSSSAVCFYKPLPAEKLTIKDLISYIIKTISIYDAVYIALITFFVTLFSMAAPLLMKIIFSDTVYSKNMGGLISMFVFIIMAGISTTLLQIAKMLILTRIQLKMELSVNAALMMRIIKLPTSFFKDYSAGELAQKVSYIKILCISLANVVFSTGLTALISLIYLIEISMFNPLLVKPATFVVAVMFTASVILTWVQSKNIKARTEIQAKEFGFLYALITGIQKIKLSGAERRAFAKWASFYKKSAELEFNPPLLLKLTQMIEPAIMSIGTFVIYITAYNAGISTSEYMAFMSAYTLLTTAFLLLSQSNLMTSAIFPLLSFTKPIIEAVPENSHGKIPSKIRGSIEINNVSFKYNEKSPLILDKLSIKINSGDYVAIVGKSGCGKSTLMRLLLGFEKPDNGVIFYDGNDLKTLDLKFLRSNIGCVMQNSKLFPGNIYSNITISAPQLTEEDAWEAAEMAGIADDIHKMPMKMNTIITEGSGTLSGGQRQRIIIARAIAPKPKILLFDEATSALDNITQKIVSDSLDKLKCTRIVIAHRLSTIKHCNKIFVLNNGNIAESGTYEELINNNGMFAELIKRQQLGEAV